MRHLMRSIWTQLWLTGVVCLVLLALYTSLGRQLVPLIETMTADIEAELSAQLGTDVSIGSLEGDWVWFSPSIIVNDLVIGNSDHPLEVQQLEAELDVSASIFYRVPVFDQIVLSGVHLPLVQDQSLSWSLGDFLLPSSDTSDEPKTPFGEGEKPLWLTLLGQQGEIHLVDWRVEIQRYEQPLKALKLLNIRLRNNGAQHWLDGEVQLVKSGAILTTQLEIEGDLWDISQHNGKGYVELGTQAWQDWIPEYQSIWQIDEISLGAKLWFEVEDGLLHNLDGAIDIPEFALTKHDSDQSHQLSFQQGQLSLAGRRSGDDWHLWFDSDLQWNSDFTLPKPQGRLSWLPSIAGGFQLELEGADLAATANWLQDFHVFEPEYMDYITHLKPRGTIEQVSISVLPELDWLWEASFAIKDGHIDAWQSIPAAEKINAQVQMNAGGGRLTLDHNDTYLHFANLYQQGWLLENTSTELFWKMDEGYLQISSPNFVSRYQGAEVNGAFSFYTPFQETQLEPQLNLLLGFQNIDLTLQSKLVPTVIPETISSWLSDNIKSGIAPQASFVFAGSLAEGSQPVAQTIQLFADIQQTHISYMPQWPEVKNIAANVLVDVPNVEIRVNQATTLGGSLVPKTGKLSIDSDEYSTWLTVRGKLEGTAQEGIQYLQHTPLAVQVGDNFAHWAATGPMTNELYARIPLSSDASADSSKIRLRSELNDVDLQIKDLDLAINNIHGALVFDSDEGLSGENIKAKAFAGDLLASISSKKQNEGFDITVTANGDAQVAAVKQRLPLFLLKPITGALGYHLDVLVRPESRGGLKLTLNSNLQGVKIATPEPFGKTAQKAVPFQLSVTKKRDLRFNFRYGDLANGVLAMEDERLTRGQVYLGTAQAYLPSDNGLSISGNIDHPLDAKAWWDLWQDIRPESSNSSTAEEPALLTYINVSAPAVNAWQQQMGASQIEGRHKWGRWLFDLDSRLMKGQIILPENLNDKVIEMDLQYIHMPVSDEADSDVRFGSGEGTDALADFDPRWIPDMNVKVAEVFLGTSNFGRWDMLIRQKEQLTRITVKDSDSKAMTIKGDIDWRKDAGGHQTHLSLLRITSSKLGDVQRGFRQAAAIEAQDAKIDLDLKWQGSPVRFNYASLNGLVKINIKDGVLVSDNADALKAFGVLNFNTISRRLKLDFSDLYEKGVVFDVLRTRLAFDDGVATFADPLWVDGPSAKFQSSGLINFNTTEIDQKMVVTFPVTSSLPLVAVLAGFAPQIAGAIYVTEKLIGEELERFTSASYTVTGTIENPKMKINQAFDNKVDGQESRSFKDRFLDIFGLGSDGE